jgi:hypothetical protein
VSLETVFASDRPALQLAREMIEYRLLLACGAGIAAMGGVDQIVFSGRYVGASRILGPWLQGRLSTACRGSGRKVTWKDSREPLDRLIADAALAADHRNRAAATGAGVSTAPADAFGEPA